MRLDAAKCCHSGPADASDNNDSRLRDDVDAARSETTGGRVEDMAAVHRVYFADKDENHFSS